MIDLYQGYASYLPMNTYSRIDYFMAGEFFITVYVTGFAKASARTESQRINRITNDRAIFSLATFL